MSKSKAILVDLDGTLCDHRHRLKFVDPAYLIGKWYCEPDYESNGCGCGKSSCLPQKVIHNGKPWKPDYEAFYAEMDKDGVNEAVSSIIHKFKDAWGSYNILFVTGRPEKYREITIEWLNDHALIWTFELFMRPDFLPCNNCANNDCGNPKKTPDHRPSRVVKREIYKNEIEGKYDVLFCLEDNEECAQMYKSLGLTVLKVC